MTPRIHALMTSRLAPAGFLASSLAAALALQHVLGWLPCPLCILQRLASLGLLLALSGLAWTPTLSSRPWGRWALWGFAGACALAGAAASLAHLWLLSQPATGACSPGLARWVGQLVDAMPGSAWFLEGAGACEDTRYTLAGLPLPAWALAVQGTSLAWALRLRHRN